MNDFDRFLLYFLTNVDFFVVDGKVFCCINFTLSRDRSITRLIMLLELALKTGGGLSNTEKRSDASKNVKHVNIEINFTKSGIVCFTP